VALTGARIVTLNGDEVIESGTLVVDGSRITCVGDCSTEGADRVVDARGKTIIPGFVDMHAHHYREHRGFRPRVDYEAAIYLAYGVTANLDNSMWSQNIFPTAELIDAGEMVGPRTYSTGDPLYRGMRRARTTSRATRSRRRTSIGSRAGERCRIKQYQQPRRDQRQWVSHIARDRGLMVTAEGGDLNFNLGMIMDGQTAWEHPLSESPVHRDVARFFGQAGAYYVPTFVVAGPGPANIDYYFGARTSGRTRSSSASCRGACWPVTCDAACCGPTRTTASPSSRRGSRTSSRRAGSGPSGPTGSTTGRLPTGRSGWRHRRWEPMMP
jgi:hypothetical protein